MAEEGTKQGAKSPQLYDDPSRLLGLAAVLAAFGLISRAGPGRAISLGLRSKFFNLPGAGYPTTDRKDLLQEITREYEGLTKNSKTFIAVAGPKVGKTCLIRTLVRHRFGIVNVSLDAGMDYTAIKSTVHRALCNKNTSTNIDNSNTAQRVVTWHNRIFRCPPTIVLEVPERPMNSLPINDVVSVARVIADMGCRVVIDSSDNAMPILDLLNMRVELFLVDDMPREMLEAIQDFRPLFSKLSQQELKDVAWFVIGGRPQCYSNLQVKVNLALPEDVPRVIDTFLRQQISSAIWLRNRASPDLKEIMLALKLEDKPFIPEGKHILPEPCRTLRISRTTDDRSWVIMPASPTMALAIRHEWSVAPSMQELKKLAASEHRSRPDFVPQS